MDVLSFILGLKKGQQSAGGVADYTEINSYLDEINGEIVGGKIVTFMVEGVEWAKVEAVPGGTCPDPASGTNKPTKTATVDQTFTFRGWSTRDGGGVDSTALTNVTEDRTVYAVFASSPRKYVINFCDEDGTRLIQKQVEYGTVPTYTPVITREDAYFDGWNPTPVAVTGPATYTIIWTPYPAFQTGTWEEIASVLNAGEGANSFSVGDRRAIPLNYPDGTSETIYFTIVDIEADTKQDGKPAQITLMADNALKDSTALASAGSDAKSSIYAYDLLSAALDRFYDAIPAEMQELAVSVKRSTYNEYRKVFLPTWMNLTGEDGVENTQNKNVLPYKQYAYFKTGNGIGRSKLGENTNSEYFTSSVHYPISGTFIAVYKDQTLDEVSRGEVCAIVPCICLG